MGSVWQYWQGSQYTMQLYIVKLVACLGWLSNIAFGQLELNDAVTDSVSFMDTGLTSLGNLAAFATSFLRGRFDLEMGARDVLATIRGPQLEDLNGFGLATDSDLQAVSVVMLSTHMPNSSMRQFMKYISNAHNVDSIFLHCLPLGSAVITLEMCECVEPCQCVIFWTVDQIIIMLALRMPGTLKQLSHSLYLLPSLECLRNGCHGCNEGQLYVEIDEFGRQRLTEGDREVDFPAAVCETLDMVRRSIHEKPTCICIPVLPASYDNWTKLLIRSFRSKDEESRGVRVMASVALEGYMGDNRGVTVETVEFSTGSLILPRVIELLVNLVLTGLFRVDGFSSSLLARRAIRDYVVDSRGNGFAANVFLTKALVNARAGNTHVCQVLTFRGPVFDLRTLSFITGGVNLMCSIWWDVAIAFGAGIDGWSHMYSRPPSILRVAFIMAATGIGLGMDCLHFLLNRFRWREFGKIWAVIVLELVFIASGGAVAGVLGTKVFGRWLYSALQCMVWVKWGFGSYLLGEYLEDESSWAEGGILIYSSAFLLNSILAGVGGKWE